LLMTQAQRQQVRSRLATAGKPAPEAAT
jgi:hypothetical protein